MNFKVGLGHRGLYSLVALLVFLIGFLAVTSSTLKVDSACWYSDIFQSSATSAAANTDQQQQPAPYAVFFNFYLSNKKENLQPTIDACKEQIHQIGTSYAASLPGRPLTLYYNTIGSTQFGPANITEICGNYTNLNCQHLRYYAKGYEEVTLTPMYDYCLEDGRQHHWVIYVHNKGSHHASGWMDPTYKLPVRQDVWRRHGTYASTDRLCLQPRNDTCNACGLLWTPMPWNHFPGNFFATKCSYVRKLLRPSHYNILHNRLMQTEYEPLMKEGKMIATKKFLMGQSRWSMEMWVGSHPEFQPCDLSRKPDIAYWQVLDRNLTEDFVYVPLAPLRKGHHIEGMVQVSAPKYLMRNWAKKSLQIRDYNMLGGMILRWKLYYGYAADSDAWYWDYYPDGQVWREAVEKYGLTDYYARVAGEYFEEKKE